MNAGRTRLHHADPELHTSAHVARGGIRTVGTPSTPTRARSASVRGWKSGRRDHRHRVRYFPAGYRNPLAPVAGNLAAASVVYPPERRISMPLWAATVVLDAGDAEEACAETLAPTTSTTAGRPTTKRAYEREKSSNQA